MDKNRINQLKSLKNIVCIVLVIFYIAGMLCMFLNNFPLGFPLFTLSTLGGMGVLYYIKRQEEKAALEKLAKENGDDTHENEA